MSEQRIEFSKEKKLSELGNRKRHHETIQRELTRRQESSAVLTSEWAVFGRDWTKRAAQTNTPTMLKLCFNLWRFYFPRQPFPTLNIYMFRCCHYDNI
jgi:hypothetical protein